MTYEPAVAIIRDLLIILGISAVGAIGLECFSNYLNNHPRKSLIKDVEKYENLYIQKHGALPSSFPERPKTQDELVKRLESLRYMVISSD